MFRLMIGGDLTLTFPGLGEGVTAVTDEVDTKTLSTKKSVLIVGQPHLSHFKYYGATPSPVSGKVKAKAFPRLHPYRSPKLFSAFSLT